MLDVLQEQSGYKIDVFGTNLEQKVAVDVTDATFWQALDKFCAAARLVEADLQDLNEVLPMPPQVDLPLQPQPPIRIKPGLVPKPPVKRPLEKKPLEKLPANALQVQVEAVPAQRVQAQPALASAYR